MPAPATEYGGASTTAAHDARLSAKALVTKIVEKLKTDERGCVSYTRHARACELLCALREAHEARASGGLQIQSKGSATSVDLVTATDQAAEKLIIDTIRARYPDHAFIGEESAFAQGSAAPGSASASTTATPSSRPCASPSSWRCSAASV